MATPSSSAPGPPKLVNLYNLRQVATAKSCFICSKETLYCLATDDMKDWFFVCKSHTLDPGFAKPASSSSSSSTPGSTPPPSSPKPTPPVSQSEIDKVKKEYEEKQKSKSSTPPSSSDSPSTSTAGKAFNLAKSSISSLSSLATSTASTVFPPPAPVIPTASELLKREAEKSRVFVLNRQYFGMRCEKKRREWEVRDAKERGKGMSFPSVPKGGVI